MRKQPSYPNKKHRPHPSPNTDKGAIASIRKWLQENGVFHLTAVACRARHESNGGRQEPEPMGGGYSG